jgi:hypothetical protein
VGLVTSVAAVRSRPVQYPIFPNLEPNLGSGSGSIVNLGLDLRFRFGRVQFRFKGGSNGFELKKNPTPMYFV